MRRCLEFDAGARTTWERLPEPSSGLQLMLPFMLRQCLTLRTMRRVEEFDFCNGLLLGVGHIAARTYSQRSQWLFVVDETVAVPSPDDGEAPYLLAVQIVGPGTNHAVLLPIWHWLLALEWTSDLKRVVNLVLARGGSRLPGRSHGHGRSRRFPGPQNEDDRRSQPFVGMRRNRDQQNQRHSKATKGRSRVVRRRIGGDGLGRGPP